MLKINLKDIICVLLYVLPNTFLNFGIVYIINNVLSEKKEFLQDYIIIVFMAAICYAYLLNIIFQKELYRYTFKILYESEKKLFSQILRAPLVALEKFGSERFYLAMQDLRTFSILPSTVTLTVSSLLMLILGLLYMFLLSVTSASIVLIIIVVIVVFYFIILNSMSNLVATSRKYDEYYYEYIKDLISGFKELKLSSVRRRNIMKRYLGPNRDKSEVLDFKINYVFLSISMISQYGLYFVIAVILFGLPALGLIHREDVIAYVIIILFISGPINNLINLQQTYTHFLVAINRLKNFRRDFKMLSHREDFGIKENHAFQSLRLENVYFKYDTENGNTNFALGPINFKLQKGEVIFILGGNGSGKSTFINLLTGLYEPVGGSIIINNDAGKNIKDDLQDSIAAIFTDNHIFSHNYENYKIENNEDYKKLLVTMQLDKEITNDQEDSVRRKFSKGQSKRVSLIFALLENKPILVLDEWAADQDPHFRKLFYEELIPNLKEAGKTVIAVTHDDAYFHHADRIVKFAHGQIVKDIILQKKEKITQGLWT